MHLVAIFTRNPDLKFLIKMTATQAYLANLLEKTATAQEWEWIQSKVQGDLKARQIAFVALPRFIRKVPVHTGGTMATPIQGWELDQWTLDRLARVYLLSHIPNHDETVYINAIEMLFDTAEINELVALYSALPLLAYPEKWLFRATEAVRSNMGVVFDAIAFGNPYPLHYFSELAWNQLVLKCIFNDKPIHLITGLTQRANAKLANTLSDFAHERWAAGRKVPAQVWRLVQNFMNDTLLDDMRRLLQSDDTYNQTAAALVCFHSTYAGAKELIESYPSLRNSVQKGQLQWKQLEVHQLCYV